jgi:hypothetical protein
VFWDASSWWHMKDILAISDIYIWVRTQKDTVASQSFVDSYGQTLEPAYPTFIWKKGATFLNLLVSSAQWEEIERLRVWLWECGHQEGHSVALGDDLDILGLGCPPTVTNHVTKESLLPLSGLLQKLNGAGGTVASIWLLSFFGALYHLNQVSLEIKVSFGILCSQCILVNVCPSHCWFQKTIQVFLSGTEDSRSWNFSPFWLLIIVAYDALLGKCANGITLYFHSEISQ